MSTARDRLKAWASGGTTATPTIPVSPASTESAGQLSARDRLKAWATQGVPASVSAPANQPTVSQPKAERVDYASQIADVDAEIKRLSNRNTTFDVSPFSEEENRQAEQRIAQLEQNKKQLQVDWQKQKDADVAAIDKQIKEVEDAAAALAKRTDLDEYTKRLESAKLNGARNQLVQAKVKADPNAVDKAWAAASSIIAGVAGGLSAAGETVKEVATGKGKENNYDPNSKSAQLLDLAAKQKELAVSEASAGGKVLGEALIGIGQTAALSSLAAINPSLPLVAMAAVAAGNKANEVKAQGGTSNQALVRGTISGGIEAATEKLPLDALVDLVKVGGKSALKNLMKQAGLEATEESVSYVANWIFDKAFKDPNAKFSWEELGQAAAGGALSGGLLSGGAMLLNRTTNAGETLTTDKDLKEAAEKAGKKEVHYLPGTGPAVNATEMAQGSAAKAAESTLPVAGKQTASASSAPSTAVMGEAEVPSTGRVNPDDSVGAAPAGFDPYGEAMLKYGQLKPGENPSRIVDNPAAIGEQKVSQSVQTVTEAAATPDAMLGDIADRVMQGKDGLTYFTVTNDETTRRAKETIEADGYEDSLLNWSKQVAAGNVSEDLTAMGALLYNAAANSGNTKQALDILSDYATLVRSGARAVQAARILKTLTPEGKLYYVQKSVDKIQRDLNERYGDGKDVDGETAKRATGAIDEAKQTAATAAANAYTGVKAKRRGNRVVIEGNQAGEPFVFEYAQKVGEAVAKGLEAKRDQMAKERTFMQQITAQVKRFATEKMPKEKKGNPMTAIDLLRDYVQNQAFYADAWAYAQEELREKYAGDPVLGEFINTGIGVDSNTNPRNAIFTRALVMAAADSGEGKSVLRRQEALGFTGMADTIAENLIQQTGATGEMADTIRDAAHSYVYEAVSEAKDDDIKLIDSAIRSAMKDIGIKIGDVVMSGTKESAQQAIVEKLVGKYGFGMAEATHTAEVVAERFGEMSRQYAENKLKSMFKERSKVRKTIPEKIETLGRLGAFDIGSTYNQQAAERIFKVGASITIDEKLAAKFLNAKTDAERDAALDDIYQNVADQVPSNLSDMFTALRYLNMLGNLRTQGRNVVGNTFNRVVRSVDRKLEALIQTIVHRKNPSNKTTTFIRDKDLYRVAKEDFETYKDVVMGDQKYSVTGSTGNDIGREIDRRRAIFKINSRWGTSADASTPTQIARKIVELPVKGMEWARNKVSDAMDVGDEWFAKPAYADRLARYLSAKGVTAEQWKRGEVDQALLDDARAVAIQEAQEATFRDSNQFSDMVSSIGFKNANTAAKRIANTVVRGTLPFRKTPANVAVQAEKHSPLGLINTAVNAAKAANPNSEVTGNDVIKSLSESLTGTGLLVLGMVAAAAGVARGGERDKEQAELDEITGAQDYSIELPGVGSMTYDWATPASMTFAMGVEMQKALEEHGVSWQAISDAISGSTNIMLEMSMLQGLNDAFEKVAYSDYPLIDAALNSLLGYMTQGLTSTLGGQIERTFEEVRETTFRDKNSKLPTGIQYTIGSTLNKVPGAHAEFQQIPYIDAWGRTEESGTVGERAFNNMLAPWYSSERVETEADKEIMRLLESGYTGVVPNRVSQSYKVTYKENPKDEQSQSRYMTADEYVQFSKTKGQKSLEVVSAMLDTDVYKNMTNEEKAKAIDQAYQYATHLASEEVTGGKHESEKYVENAQKAQSELGLSEAEFLLLYEKYGGTALNGDGVRDAYASGLDVEDYLNYHAGRKGYDADRNKSYTIGETNAAIKGSGLSPEDQVLLWLVEKPEWAEQASKIGVSNESYVKYKVAVNSIVGKKNSANIGKVIRALDIPQEDKRKLLAAN